MTAAFDPARTYVELDGRGGGRTVAVTNAFWPDLMAGRLSIEGRLVTCHRFATDVAHWEMHPAGEELLVALGGRFAVELKQDGRERTEPFAAGQALLVPRGAWHRLRVLEPGEILFVTWGEGTQHRPG